jgi:folate-binding protein YgfZ
MSGALDLAESARLGCGLAPLPGWRVYELGGRDALDLASRLSTADLAPLSEGRAVTTLFLTPTGRLRYRVLLQPAAGGIRALLEPHGAGTFPEWLEHYTFAEDVRVVADEAAAALVLVGPEAAGLAASRAPAVAFGGGHGLDDEGIAWSARSFGPLPGVVATGPAAAVESAAAGLSARAVRLSEGALLQLRVDCGVPASGAEITEEYHPAEAGLLADVSFTKGCYVGQEVVARQDTYGKVARRLVGLEPSSPLRPGDELASEQRAGCRITSVAPEAAAGEGAARALAYVRSRSAEAGATVRTAAGVEARVVPLPFPPRRAPGLG